MTPYASLMVRAAAAAAATNGAGPAKGGQTAADKAEKARQVIASLRVTRIYNYIAAGVLGLFVLRHVLRQVHWFVLARRARVARETAVTTSEKGSHAVLVDRPALLRLSDTVDTWMAKPLGVWPFTPEWTRMRALLVTLIVTVACLVVDTKLHTPATLRSNVARAFSRRCGRMAAANFPLLYLFAGRNSVVVFLTGEYGLERRSVYSFEYQTVRFYHKILGFLVFLQCFVHTFSYIGYYLNGPGAEALHEEWTETYLKLGIVALVGGAINCLIYFRFLRVRMYEILLLMHAIGAVFMLVGAWYHRPIMRTWVWAAVGIWAFERLTRLVLHISSFFALRQPLVNAQARVVSGAILLSIPFPSNAWSAGQHVYVSFWGIQMLKTPWVYGQSHPFSIANASGDKIDHIELVMRIKSGMTQSLAKRVASLCAQKGVESVGVLVSVEGPHGGLASSDLKDEGAVESLVLVAGGSGITHVSSILGQAMAQPSRVLKKVNLVWAIQSKEQIEWIRPQLTACQELASSTSIALSIDIYVTRHGAEALEPGTLPSLEDVSPGGASSSSNDDSGVTTPSEMPERKYSFGEEAKGDPSVGPFVRVHRGRPDTIRLLSQAIESGEQRFGRALVVSCGPDTLNEEVRLAAREFDSSVEVQITKFDF
ncbi:BZ3500_MvSof-1268-A1-R1_Chr6-3g08979 [Microbotryum saponariae]|uniref:BZ3500_MvSof-1268-A1-R1_Chr6-3g08979 protein n=1 Tax=Microbotryum saponariae TaxID=289078 RepID=A0A2X0LKC9_9BASI|nr:BZ3500_MvSof-1268-A1-R1_Chr6-3g08979 [Microbotryum saponariae]SDA07581.1 BZ3501_MvSof-1269-A2-R1_Chr6-2g08683 [Microbotryum saponariae]